MISTTAQNGDAAALAQNLRRLMARDGLTFDDVVAASQLDERTLRAVARGRTNPHARTLHKLAHGLGVSIDELFRTPGQSPARRFDRATNSLVEEVVAAHAAAFENWTEADFDELYSRFGTGGQLTQSGVLAAANAMNAKRDVLRQAAVVLESGEAELLAEFVELLYRRTTEPQRGDMAHPKKSATQQRKKMPRISEGLLDIRVSLLWV
ncbi:MAG: helix-turn-helix domain-containing protein, partial [Planctomycetes bacterium]|nr:helix-turn-helix domain-containing protein [Planctomycetota bacterium]